MRPAMDNDVDALIAEATLAQRPYVADGRVTPAERESAFLAFLACETVGSTFRIERL